MAFTFQTKPPRDLPAKAKVYSLLAPKLSTATMKATARSMGLEWGDLDLLTSTDRMGAVGGRWQIEIQRASGALQAMHIDKYGFDSGEPFKLTDRRAQTLAGKFLAQSKLVPVDSARVLKVTHLRGADGDVSGEKVTERVLDAGVLYGRLVDAIPVIGPGGLAMVHLDGRGDLVGVRTIWRTLGRSAGTVKIRPVEWAVAGLQEATSSALGDVSVLKAEFGYFELGVLDRQQVLEPVYAFVYTVRNKDIASKHVHVVHAGDNAYGKLSGRRRFPSGSQRARLAPKA